MRHRIGCFFRSDVSVGGQSSGEWLPLAMVIPGNAWGKCVSAASTGHLAKSLVASQDALAVDTSPATPSVMERYASARKRSPRQGHGPSHRGQPSTLNPRKALLSESRGREDPRP